MWVHSTSGVQAWNFWDKRTSLYIKNIPIKQLCNQKVWDFATAFQIRRLFRSFKGLELEIPGGGVGVYVWQTYKVKLLGDLSYISDNDLHQLSINRQLRNLKSIVGCKIYRPLDCSLTSRFDTNLAPKWIIASFKLISVLGHGTATYLSHIAEKP